MVEQTSLKVRDGGYSAVLDAMNIRRQRLTAYSDPVDLSKFPQDGVIYGGLVRNVSGKEAGPPLKSLHGAKSIPFSGSKEIDLKKQKSGLFIVGIDYVPVELTNFLKLKGLVLLEDGSLVDEHGDPVIGFVTSEMYHVKDMAPKTSAAGFTADAAPFPFTCFSFTPAAFYHETGFAGNHRWYDASTLAVAFGPDSRGGCSNASPHTRIDFLQAIAAVNSPGNSQQAFATDQLSAHDVWDVGYGWPAHGVPVTTHSAIWADGTFSMSRTANLSW